VNTFLAYHAKQDQSLNKGRGLFWIQYFYLSNASFTLNITISFWSDHNQLEDM